MNDTPAKRGLQTTPKTSAGPKQPATKRTPLVAPVIPATKPPSFGQQLLKYRVHLVLGAVFFLLVWALVAYWPSGRVNQMKNMLSQMQDFNNMSDEEKRSKLEEMSELRKKLTPEEQHALQKDREDKTVEKFLKPFFAKSKEERDKILDKQIEMEDKWKADRDARRAQFEGAKPGGAQGNQAGNAGQPGGGGGNQGTPGGNPQAGGNTLSPERQAMMAADQNNMQKTMISLQSPEFRALMQQYWYERIQRRQQLGLPPR